jgi:hypothetical protein
VNKEIEAGERERPAERPRVPAAAKPASGRPAGRTEGIVRQEIEAAEEVIAELEVRHRELTERYSQETDAAASARLWDEVEAVTARLSEAEDEWARLHEEAEGLA